MRILLFRSKRLDKILKICYHNGEELCLGLNTVLRGRCEEQA
nr:MAG TPA: hypothetical protein [Caudoviricetes sp.]